MSHQPRSMGTSRSRALLRLPCIAAAVVLLASCASGSGSAGKVVTQNSGFGAQSCDEARARVDSTLWPSGPDTDPRLAPKDVPRYVETVAQMLSTCSAIATAAHRRERELSLIAAEEVVRKDLAQMGTLNAASLAAMLPTHAQHVRRYVAQTQALRGRSE